MRKIVSILIGLAMIVTSFVIASPSAYANPTYYLSGLSIDAPTFTSDPGATTISATISLTLNYISNAASSQTFTGTAYLIRDDVVVDSSTFSVDSPSSVVSSTVKIVNVSLDTGASTVSYLKLKVVVKDSYSGAVKTAEKLLYVSNAGYRITDLNVSSVKVPWSDVIQAKVYDYNGNLTDGYPAELKYLPDGSTVANATVTSGILLMVASLNNEGDYEVSTGIAKAKIKARYNFQLTGPTSPVRSGDAVVISGKVMDSSNNPVSGVSMCLYNTSDNSVDTPIQSLGDTSSNGLFAAVWDTTYDAPGTYYVGVCGLYHGHDYASITLKPQTFSIVSSVSEVYAGLPRTQNITFTVKNGTNPVSSSVVYYTIKNNDTVIYDHVGVSTDPEGKFTVVLPENLNAGNLSVSVDSETSSGIWGKASISIPVTIPDKISFEISGLTNPLNVEDYNVTIEALSNITPPATIDNIKVSVSGPVIVDGLGGSNTGTITNGASIVLKVLSYGTVRIRLDATDSKGNKVSKMYTYSVNGYAVSYNKRNFVVNHKDNIIVHVVDSSGTPINNAVVKLVPNRTGVFDTSSGVVNTLIKDGSVDNIVNGDYVFTATFLKAADIDVFVYKSDGVTLMYRGYKALVVNPVMDLKLIVSPKKIIAGFSTPVTVAVRKADNTGVDAYVYLKDMHGDVLDTKFVSSTSPTTTFNVLMNPGEKFEIFALTTDYSHGAKDQIKAYNVLVSVSPTDGLITAGENDVITATVFNPFNNLPISVESINISGVNVEFTNTSGSNAASNTNHISYSFTASIVDTSTNAFAILKIENEGITLYQKKFAVVPPKLEISPSFGYVGVSNKFHIVLTDAHGNPLGNRLIKVYQGSIIVGNTTTNSSGEADFTYNAPNTGILTFKYGKYAKKNVTIQVDAIPPTIIAVTPTTGTIVNTDKINAMVVVFEGQTELKEITARNLDTGDITYGMYTTESGTITARLILRLTEGVNNFVIQAVDKAGNTSEPYFYKVIYKKPVDNTPPQIISITPPSGATVTTSKVKVALEIEDDTALDKVYVDYELVADNLGIKHTIVYFTVNLKEGKNIINVVISDKEGNLTKLDYVLYYHNPTVTIQLRINSQFYKVNGKTHIMDAAPFIDPRYGRTMVPLRFIAEALGLNVDWNAGTRRVIVDGTLAGTTKHIEIPLGKPKKVTITVNGVKRDIYEVGGTIYVDGVKVDIKKAGWGTVVVYQNRTFVPIRFIAELFGCTVNWNPPDGIEIVYTP